MNSMEEQKMTSMEEQKKIAIEMWQYIKSLIENDTPFYNITWAKQTWLKHNYPKIHWKCECILCDIYMYPNIVDDCVIGFKCQNCLLSKKYKRQASYGCSYNQDTPWARIVNYKEDKKAAIEACDEIIAVIKELPVSIGDNIDEVSSTS